MNREVDLSQSASPVGERPFVMLVLERNLEDVSIELGEAFGVLGNQKDSREPLNVD